MTETTIIEETTPAVGIEDPQPVPAKKQFTRAMTQRVIDVSIEWPTVYPDYEPWTFKLRLTLSNEMQEKREKWLALPATKRNSQSLLRGEIISEVCDLLVDYPTGFGDFDLTAQNSRLNPGDALRAYLNSTTDPDQYETIYTIIEAVDTAYWGKCLPREFRETLPNIRS